MKKIVSLLMIMAIMLLSFGTVFAADYTGMKIVAVEDETGLITVTVYMNETEAVKSGKVTLKLNGVQPVLASDKTTAVTAKANVKNSIDRTGLATASWTVTLENLVASQNLYSFTLNDPTNAGVAFNDTVFAKMYFKKTNAEATLTTDAFSLDSSYKLFATSSYLIQYTTSSTVTHKANPEKFSISVTPYTATEEKWQETIDTKLPTGDDVKFPAAKGEDSTVDNDAKKVVIFAKNTTGDKLVGTESGVANYGITIGGMYYPGFLDVPAGANWSIILVDPNGELTGKSFSASATVAGETKPLSNVSFE